MMIRCTENIATWTPDDIDHGETYNHESIDLEFSSVRDLLHHLRDYSDLSASGIDAYTWASYSVTDYRTGNTLEYSLHITEIDGKAVTAHQLSRIFAVAGLYKPAKQNVRI